MADPRLNLFNFAGTILNRNPSIFGIPHATSCPTVVQRLSSASTAQNSAAGQTLGVVGEFANFASSLAQGSGTVGGGQVAAGLQQLARVSDQVRRVGLSAMPANATGNGQSYVLQTVGIDPNALIQTQKFSPSVANTALGAASQVYNRVQQGKFSIGDVPAAFSAFQNGAAMITSLFSPNSNVVTPKNSQFGNNCGASPYALDLIALAPKYKFLFVVQLEFDPQFQSEILSRSTGIDPAFVIKASTRPSVDFEYEDVNMYNFRTKVARKTTYQPITMRFYDDDKNNAMQLYTTYLKLISPIANLDAEINKFDPLDMYDMAGGGMGFTSASGQKTTSISAGWSHTTGKSYPASLGVFGDNSTRNILRAIRIFHVYRQGRMMNVYNFYNPKITKMDLDDLDMASNDPTEVALTFSYDSMFIIPGYRVFNSNRQPSYNLNAMTGDGLYPFGADPSTKFNDNNPKDGFGMAYGQDTLFASEGVPQSAPSSTTTAQGTNLTGLASIAPNVGGGGTGTISNPAVIGGQLSQTVQTAALSSVEPGGTVVSTASGTTTTFDPTQIGTTTSFAPTSSDTTALIDPVTGLAQTSANNSADLNAQTAAYQTQLAQLGTDTQAKLAQPGLTTEQIQNINNAAYNQKHALDGQYTSNSINTTSRSTTPNASGN